MLWLVPPVLLGVLAFMMTGDPVSTELVVASAVLAALAAFAARSVLFTGKPLPLDSSGTAVEPATIAVQALEELRRRLLSSFAVAEAGLLIGVVLAILSGNSAPYLAAVVISWPALVLNGPTQRTIERIRVKLEAAGRPSYLWEALTEPVPASSRRAI